MALLRFTQVLLLVVLAVLLLVATTAGTAQSRATVYRIGILTAAPSATYWTMPNIQAFFDGLRQHGYVEGQNFAIEFRSAEGKLDRLPALAADLVATKPDVMFIGTCGAPLDAARRASSIIPIVVAACTGDMVAAGIVKSLARPGGNVTGLQKLNPELAAKRLEFLKQVVPQASRVAVIWDPGYSDFAADWSALRAAAETLGVTLHSVEARAPTQLETAFSTMTNEHADAFITFADSLTYVHARKVADLAATSRVPAMYAYREITEAEGLMSYGPNIPDMFRRASVFVDKILKGAKPGDLPIEQPTKFELVINLKTAKALGLTIPESLRARADKTIE